MKNIRLLIADDHALLRIGLNAMLKTQSDITVAGEAANGREAVAMAAELHPDVVIMDLMMPKLTGMDLLKILKSDEVLRRIPVIVLNTVEKNRALRLFKDIAKP